MTKTSQEMGRLVGEALLDEGVSQASFARLVGISAKHLCRVIKGSATASPDLLDYFAYRLGRRWSVSLQPRALGAVNAPGPGDTATGGDEVPLPAVARVVSESASRVEPGLEDGWSAERRLAWKAAVTALDSGLGIRLYCKDTVQGLFTLVVGGACHGPATHTQAWSVLDGAVLGASAARRGRGQAPHWRPMRDAPRDGTVVEFVQRCEPGVEEYGRTYWDGGTAGWMCLETGGLLYPPDGWRPDESEEG